MRLILFGKNEFIDVDKIVSGKIEYSTKNDAALISVALADRTTKTIFSSNTVAAVEFVFTCFLSYLKTSTTNTFDVAQYLEGYKNKIDEETTSKNDDNDILTPVNNSLYDRSLYL